MDTVIHNQRMENLLLRFVIRRPRSEKEISTWFQSKKVNEKDQQRMFTKLKRMNLVNDLEFAKWWIRYRKNFNPRSTSVLKLELQQKGVNKNLTQKALSKEGIDDYKTAKKIVSKKLKHHSFSTSVNQKQKIYSLLARKGFQSETIRKIIDALDQER